MVVLLSNEFIVYSFFHKSYSSVKLRQAQLRHLLTLFVETGIAFFSIKYFKGTSSVSKELKNLLKVLERVQQGLEVSFVFCQGDL